ncbi:hypothetical protein ANANG_G00007450 [Anguilla anguilla]|uniref:Rad21/Rec8-like protein N-terminal domain-containing protein n=1 Tax=Anguilla anguilla TaxID=7936 RepID=A0A9D3N076_ANGAN|nr:hypothetical protein ANANG_G00007450 [Anguilla anguilla]
MDYVLVRAPPLQPGLPRPRFSLYLSFQLQYGVIIVYHRQCALLLEEIQHTIDRLLRSAKTLKIDLVEPDRPALTVPDGLSMLEECERAQDPFFGVMEYAMPSPSTIMQQWQVPEETSPQRPLVERLGTPQRDSITASPESITLVDRELVVTPAAEFEGADLPEVTPRHMDIIDMLMEQQDQFPEEVEEREEVREAEISREQQQAAVSALQLGVTAVTAEISPCCRRGRRRRLRRPALDPAPAPAPAPLETTPPEPAAPPKKPRRRRQLLFIDEQTQIPSEELQEAIQDPLTETQALVPH